jgi:hypothetical protein
MGSEPRNAVVDYPGGIRGRYRWGGSGDATAVFALSEAGGSLEDLGSLVSSEPDRLCRAELRVEHPAGAWSVRLASPIYDEPTGLAWDTAGLLVVRYGFATYAFGARTGALAWHHRSGSPIVALLGSPRLDHVLIQAEVETFAVDAEGEIVWRAAHSDVVAEAALVGGRLVLTSFGGGVSALDPATGRMAG